MALRAQNPFPANDGFDPNANGIVNSLAVQPDGKILMGGYFTQIHPFGSPVSSHAYVARLNHDGSVDTTFSPNANGVVRVLALQNNGQIIIGGSFTNVQPSGGGASASRMYVARLNADGSLDSVFNPNANGTVFAVAIQPNGQIVIGGSFTSVQPGSAASPTTRNHIARFNVDGSLDTGFDPNTDRPVLSLAVQPNGQLVVGGGFTKLQPNGSSTATTRNCIARINSDGSLDTSFDPEANGSVNSIAVLPSGQIIIAGGFVTLQPNGAASVTQADFLARLNTNGTIDSTFIVNPLSSVTTVAVQVDGRIIIGGTFTSVYPANGLAAIQVNYIARINTDGSVDSSFDPNPDQAVNAVAVQQDGSVILGGFFEQIQTADAITPTTRNFIARVGNNGSLDATLEPDAGGVIYATATLPSGQTIVGGSFTSIGGVTRQYLARLNADGSLDTTYAPTLNGTVHAISVQSNGQVLVGGSFTVIDGVPRNYIARLNADGSVDGPFNPNANSEVFLIVPQGNQFIISGFFTVLTPNGVVTAVGVNGFSRINSDGSVDLTFNPNPTGGSVFSIAFMSDGRMVVGGEFTQIGGYTRGYAARLLATGVMDPADFDPEANGPVYAVAVQSDGKIVIGGAFTAVVPQTGKLGTTPTTTTNQYGYTITVPAPGTDAETPIYINHLARFSTDSTLDTTFMPDPSATVQALAIQSDGSIIVGGAQTSFAPDGNPTGTIRNYIGRVGADGSLDAGFDPNANGPLDTVSLLSGGQIMISGSFTTLQPNGAAAPSQAEHIAILNADGSIQTSFSPNGGTTANGQVVTAAALLPGGQMLVGGSFSPIGGAPAANLAVFNPDGTANSGFNAVFDGPVNAISVPPNGASTPTSSSYAVWLESTGSVRYQYSAASNGEVTAVAQQPDGKVLVGGLFTNFAGESGYQNLARINTDGTVDTTFNPAPNGQVNVIAVQPNGQILIGGNFTAIQVAGTSVAYSYLARLNSDGTVDMTFNPEPDLQVNSIAIQSNGQIVVGGYFTTMETASSTTLTDRNFICRLNADGTLDTTFNPDFNGVAFALLALPNGQILAGGAFTGLTPNATGSLITQNGLARLNSDGTLDTTFIPDPNGTVFAMALQADGQILVGGNFTTFLPNPTYTTTNGIQVPSGTTYTTGYLARLSPLGIPDTSFYPFPNSSITTIVVQPNGQILVGGNFTGFAQNNTGIVTNRNYIARVNANGTIDGSFDPELNAAANAIALLADGSVFVGGNFTVVQTGSAILVGGAFAHVGGNAVANLVRLNADSTVDATFSSNPDGPVNSITQQGTGGAYIGGSFAHIAGQSRPNIAHLNSDGSLDISFNPGANAQVNVVALQPDAQIVVGGTFTSVGGQPATYLARIGPTGARDASFAPAINGPVNAVVIQPGGKIVIAGAFTSVAGQPAGGIARLNSNGSLDPTFSPNANGAVQALTQQVDGSIYAGGAFTTIGGQSIPYVARIESNGTVDPSFNPGPNGAVDAVMVQADGKVVLGGSFTSVGGLSRYLLARLSTQTEATQSLTVSADESTITWTRGGGGPAFSSVQFQESTDGTHFTSVGQATTTDGATWQVSGLSPEGSPTFVVLAIGVTPSSRYGSSGLIEALQSVNVLAIPVISSQAQATGVTGTPFTFTVTATQLPTFFAATGLPPGLSISPTTGVISGTPTGAGTYAVEVTAGNASGSSTMVLTITIGGAAGSGTSFAATSSSSGDRLLNLSCRAQLSGSNILIAGFVISGTGQKTVLLRAVGPGLTPFDVAGVMPNPELQLYSGSGAIIAQNSGWGGGSSLAATFAQVGAFALAPNSADSAIVANLSPGPYTLQVFDPSGAGGVVLAEIYDASASPLTAPQRLVNISARGSVSPGAGALIGGFVVSGSATKSVLIRGVGPGLAAFGVTGWLADPILSVFDSGGNLVARNSNWGTQAVAGPFQADVDSENIVTTDASVGAFALVTGSPDTALIANLPPGAYTFEVTSASNSTGAALGEVYELP